VGAAGLIGLLVLPAVGGAQQVPTRPPGVTDQQIQQAIEQRGLGDQLRQRIQQSGMTPDQIRARLRAAGYSENLIDAYLERGQPGQAAPAPTLEVLRAAASLGFADFALADTALAQRDSLVLTRSDSFLLDTLGFIVGRDTIPTRRDTLGTLRIDSAAVVALANRIRRPRVFGLDIFRRTTNQFAAVTSGPVDSDYRLGAGDELVLILTGDVELAHSLPVTREGFIVIPQVGQIFVANLTLEQLRTLLYSRLGRVYSGVRPGSNATTRFEITVSRLRVNQVFVNGEVVRPGAYAVSAIGTVMNALYQAGGPTERGSFRAVRVLRRGQLVRTLDLYDYLLGGNTRDDIRLEQGDVVFVPPRGRRVTIDGQVLRPAIYELAEGQDLREALQMAGGLLPEAYTGRAQIERILPPGERLPGGRDRTVLDVDLAQALAAGGAAVPLAAEDRLRVFAVAQPLRNRVAIRGSVWRPGTYELDSGMTLARLLNRAGGLKTDTYLERAHILRLMPDSTRRLIPVNLREVAAGTAGGPALQEFDEITVFTRTEFRPSRQIAVYGSVQRPGLYQFRDSMTLRDAVLLAGGLRDEAYLLEAEIARIPEERQAGELARVFRVPLDSGYVPDPTSYLRRETGARVGDTPLQPYDNLYIRRVPGFELQRNVVLSGEVRFPGRYALQRRDERLLDVINRAGGLTDAAYVQGAQFYRAEGRAGRIGVSLERVLRDSTYRDNLILFAGDSLHVPLYQSVVVVEGAVNSPVAVAFVPRRGASYYVDRAGGFARRADKGRTYVVQPNGGVERASARVQPGARVVVPEVPADEVKTNWAAILSGVATILTSALTIVLVVQRL
jgi:protein involved in polysaccharide export with SLBB domain